ncbi:drug/metabolite transporter (DMT)-like permease [Balneicella halophila]|uniref:Drug/metabolite transporter (DMT)-like permease n=1 Tax=Balneicella halophila TaxID=1537566 RepID=A0A7L4UMZ9_BALHA|nr:DMT family transporter [Balneicella halophila]PVX50004.1 drug/metabolite transporter (DMT)-like permease [Balneicella halophila]
MKQNHFFNNTIFLAIVACFLWSTAFVGIKIGLRYTTPLQFAGIRFFLSGLMILPFVQNFPAKWKIAKAHWKIIILVALLQTTLVYALFYTGLEKVPASLGAMLIGAGPLFASLVAHFMTSDDKLSKRKTSIIFLGMLGVAIISLNKENASMHYPLLWLGIVLLLFNNIIGGIGNVVISKYGKGLPPMVLSSFSLVVGGAALFIISLFFEKFEWKIYPKEYYLSLAWLSFLSAAAITIWFSLLKRPGVKVSDLNTWKFITPVLGAILSWIILPDEYPTFLAIVGMCIIAIALILLNTQIVKKKKSIS